MKTFMMILTLMCATGCKGLNRIIDGAESRPPETPIYNAIHVIEGVTVNANDRVDYVPLDNREITVEVKKPGETEFHTLNQYEYKVLDEFVPGIQFQRRVDLVGQVLVIPFPPQWVAPPGTQYIITAALK